MALRDKETDCVFQIQRRSFIGIFLPMWAFQNLELKNLLVCFRPFANTNCVRTCSISNKLKEL